MEDTISKPPTGPKEEIYELITRVWHAVPERLRHLLAIVGAVSALVVVALPLLNLLPSSRDNSADQKQLEIANINIKLEQIMATDEPNAPVAAANARVIVTLRNRGDLPILLKGISVSEIQREYHPFAGGLSELTVSFKRMIVVGRERVSRNFALAFQLAPKSLGQFALIFISDVPGQSTELWLELAIESATSTAIDQLHFELQNYGYSITETTSGDGFVVYPTAP